MYLKDIIDKIGEAVNDTTLMSTGTYASRTKSWVQEFYFLDLLPRYDWSFTYYEGAFNTTSGTQRYNLPRWIDHPSKIANIIHPTTRKALVRNTLGNITGKYSLTTYSDPEEYVVGPRTRTSYSTGTVTGISSAKTLTGSSTSWLSSDIQQFDYIQVGSYAYTVDSVDSNTQITLFEDINVSFSASTYTAVLDRWTIDLYPIPNATLAMIVSGSKLIPSLDDDSDIPILPDNWHFILVKAGIVRAKMHNQEDFTNDSVLLENAIKKMISEDGTTLDYLDSLLIPKSRGY